MKNIHMIGTISCVGFISTSIAHSGWVIMEMVGKVERYLVGVHINMPIMRRIEENCPI